MKSYVPRRLGHVIPHGLAARFGNQSCTLSRPARWLLALGAACLFTATAALATTLVQEFYLPMPEQQIYTADSAFETGVGTTFDSTFSVVVTGDGTVVYYDQWEDGYETDLSNPGQATTKIWGDGNDANGIAPGFANDPAGLPAGTVLTLRNNVTLPRNPSTILYDARDRVAATKALVISRAAWPTAQGSVFAGSVSVYSTIDYGTQFISPVGQDITNRLFQYVGLFVMAAQDNTAVTIDSDGGGTNVATFVTLNRGESYLVNGGIRKGGTVNSTKPVQAHLLIGHIAGRYASDWFNLTPVDQWDNTYYTPVPTPASGNSTFVYLYNRNSSPLTINYTTRTGSGSFAIPATNVFQFQMPQGSGAKFVSSTGSNFVALCTVASKDSSDAAYNWGFTLVPKDALTTEAVVGWGPGSSDGTANGSPAWVTPVANTTIYVDFNGDHLGSGNINGLQYDVSYNVTALESKKVFDPDKNQTAMRIFTVDGTLITAAWGEDADTAAAGNPYIDAGTIVLPFPVPTLVKSSAIVVDNPPSGLSINDIIEYTVTLDNKGLLPLGNTVVIDAPSANLQYVTNTTTLDGVPLADSISGTAFPLDAPGYTIPVILRGGNSTFTYRALVTGPGAVSNSVNVGGTTISSQSNIDPTPGSGATSCSLNFSDSAGNSQTSYLAGAGVYVTLADGDKNTVSNTVQTLTATVLNNSRNDQEIITLTETGTNTGVFRNSSPLPTSLSSGLAQQDGTLNVAIGDSLTVTNVDAVYADTCTASANITAPPQTKVLYLSSVTATNTLYRVDPVAAGRTNTIQSVTLGSSASNAVVTLDSTSSLSNSSASSLTISHTTSGANRLMMVSVAIGRSGPGFTSVGGITYAASNLTFVGATNDSANVRCETWRLVNPPAITTNVVITLAAAKPVVAVVNTFTGVDQTTPLGTYSGGIPASAGKAATNVSTSASGELVYSAFGVDGDNSRPASALDLTPGAGQTVLKTNNGGNFIGIAVSTKDGASSVTNSWTWTASDQQWAFGAVAIKPASSGGSGNSSVTFTQTPAFCENFTLSASSPIHITNYISITSGAMPGSPAISAQLKYGSTIIITLTNAVYNSSSNSIVWSGTLSSNITIPSGQAIACVVSNAQSGVTYKIDYDSATKPSKITLPTTTVIDVTSVGVYDAAYPGGSLVSSPSAGQTVYVRTTVDDPFGSYDVTSLDLANNGPGTASDISTNLTSGSVVADDGCTKTYEYAWHTTADTGSYDLTATGNEGSEGITDTAAASVTLSALDLGMPSAAEFTSGNNGTSTNAFSANSSACVRVTDLDQNHTNSVAENLTVTVSSSSGDSETLVLTEATTNSGIFTACLTTSTNSGNGSNNGTLLAPAGSLLTVSYTDPTDSGDTASANATILTAPGVPAITMNKTLVSPAVGRAESGSSVQFNLQIINSGSTTLTNISVADTFPAANLTFVSASVTPSAAAGTLTWTNLGAFTAGQITNITVNFTASNTVALMTNTARAASIGGATNTGTATLTITRSALAISKTVIAPINFPVGIGTNVTFRIVVANTGSTTINNLPLEDSFSAGCFQYVTNLSGVAPDGVGAGSLLWNDLGPLAAGASVTNEVEMKAVGGCDPAENTAHADFAVDQYGNIVPSATSTASTTNIAARITGAVYNDLDRSGTITGEDTGLAGVTLALYTDPNADGDPADGALVQLTTSDASGNYELLNLTTGAYVVVETDLAGFASVAPLNNRIPVIFSALTTNAGNNFFDHVNEAPVANDDAASTPKNVAVTVNPLLNDTDADSDALTVTSVNPTNGTASILGGTNVVFTPDTNFLGTAYVGYTIADSHGATASAVITISITNRPPLAVGDSATTAEDTDATIAVLENDTDADGDALTIVSVSTTNGTANNVGTNVVYTPSANFNGTNVMDYCVTDGLATNCSTITVVVTPVNDAPVANPDSTTVTEDADATIAVLENDTDVDGDVLTIVSVSTTNGTANIVGTNVVYTPAANFNGTNVMDYCITDGAITNCSTITVVVTPVNDAPVANPDNATIAEDTDATIPALVNDTDVDGDTLSLVSVTTTNGTASIVGTNVVYTPSTNFNGTNVMDYCITDGTVTNCSTITVGVMPVNDDPVANPDEATTAEDTDATVPALVNDTDVDGDTLSLVSVTTTNGTANIAGTNVVYTPSANFYGTNVMTYCITDGAATNCSTITIVVTPVDDDPVANPDEVTTAEDADATIPALVNDSDDDGDTLSLVSVTTTNGTATIVGTNVVYTPAANFNGTNVMDYCITAGAVTTCSTITVVVTPVNDAPVAVEDAFNLVKNNTLTVPAAGVLTNDTDADGDVLTAILVSTTTNGVLALNTNGSFTYAPVSNFFGTDSFTYYADDGTTNSGPATVTINVLPSNTAPVANDDSYTTAEDTLLTVLAGSGVLTNDLDVDGDILSAVLVSNVTHGTLSLATNGGFTYTPAADFHGTDTFTYYTADAITNSSVATVTITVTSVNDVPVANPDTATVAEDTDATIAALENDTDVDGDTLSLVSVTTTNGTASIIGTNVVYTPSTNFHGTNLMDYCITDGTVTNCSKITVVVTPVNDTPAANPDSATTAEDTDATIPALVNDTDDDGDTLSLVSVTTTNGTVNIVGTNVVYTPSANFHGTNVMDYCISDGLVTNCSTITVVVTPVNDAPVAVSDAYIVNEDTLLAIPAAGVLTNDTDVDGDVLTAILVTTTTNGVVTLNINGSFTYQPDTNFHGTDTFTYYADDGTTNSSIVTVTITVNSVNTPPVANPDSASTFEDTPVTISVVTNDYDTELDSLTVTNATTTSGTVTILGGTNLFYMPATDFAGVVSFTYIITDGNGGSATGLVTVTVTRLADVRASKTGPASGNAGSNLTYTITVTNLGPSTASNVVVSDVLPAGFTLMNSDPAGAVAVSNVLSWPAFTLTENLGLNFTVTVVSSNGGSFTNIAFAESTTPDPDASNNNGSQTNAQVVTVVTAVATPLPGADVAVLKAGPANIVAGNAVAYTLTVTNFGPDAASGVAVTDRLPANTTFLSASAGGVYSATSNSVTWPAMGALPAGGFTNLTLTLVTTNLGQITNVALGTATTPDPNVTNNNGMLPESRVVTLISPAGLTYGPFGFTNREPIFNPQTGLYHETVYVTNSLVGATVTGFRLYVVGLRAGVYLQNAYGTNNGQPYVQYNPSLPPGGTVRFLLEFLSLDRRTFTNSFRIEANLQQYNPNTNGTSLPTTLRLNETYTNGAVSINSAVLEFGTIVGRRYTILYRDDVEAPWKAALPSVTAGANAIQWLDFGPPKTETVPGSQRYYNVLLLP